MTPDGFYTMEDIGYDDPELLNQLNANVQAQKGGPVTSMYMGRPYVSNDRGYGALAVPYTQNWSGGTNFIPTASPPPPVPGGTPNEPPTGFAPMAPMPTYPALPFDIGGAATGAAAAGLCDKLPPGYREACKVALGVLGGSSSSNNNPGALTPSCSPGYTWNSTLKQCVKITNALPGGDPLTQSRTALVPGGLGMAAVQPVQVGYITRNDGTTSPIMRCPKRYVLGMDYLCYPKSMIPNKLRAHPRGTRPFLTGGEMKTLRKAHGLSKKAGKLGKEFGPKVCHCSPKGKKK